MPDTHELAPEHQHDLARTICGLPPLHQSSLSCTSCIVVDLRAISIEISQHRSF
jgi:hypothetical protein